jgi:thiamine biosynthesis protein ThiI
MDERYPDRRSGEGADIIHYTHAVVHYAEIGLKRGNRDFFEMALVKNIRRRITEKVRRTHGRLLISLSPESDIELIASALFKTFGIANFAFALRTKLDITEMIGASLELARVSDAGSFRIATRRSNKKFPLTSTDVNQKAGAAVVSELGKRVNLSEPELTINIEITSSAAYVYADLRRGPGGLPVGVSGNVLALVSGGIDSPVAAIQAMKRGCKCVIVHFHNYTFYKDFVRNKIIGLAKKLTDFNYSTRLIIVPFVDVQREIVQKVSADYRMIAYRRAMFRICEKIADREDAKAFVTGDSIGQVASQTLENLGAIHQVANRPVVAPLIAYDKSEILNLAREFGTYEISTLPYNDCCSAFVARHPATHAKQEVIEDMEEEIEFGPLIEKAIADAEVLVL